MHLISCNTHSKQQGTTLIRDNKLSCEQKVTGLPRATRVDRLLINFSWLFYSLGHLKVLSDAVPLRNQAKK